MKEPDRAINKDLFKKKGGSSIKLNRRWFFQNDP